MKKGEGREKEIKWIQKEKNWRVKGKEKKLGRDKKHEEGKAYS